MKVKALTPHGERLLVELRRNGDIQIEPEGGERLPVDKEMSFREILEAARGSITQEEGEALIARIRYERDHDWD